MKHTRTAAESISSQQTERSEIQKRALKLGKSLVQSLGLEPGVDTLSRWMAHYIAEQIATIKRTKGKEKKEAEERCFDTILKLWSHRSLLPNGSRPFESFEPIFRALERLDPENARPFYAFHENTEKPSLVQPNRVKQFVDLSLDFDRSARAIVQFMLRQAATIAVDEKTKLWLKNAIGESSPKDFSIIFKLFSGEEHDEDPVTADRRYHVEYLRGTLQRIEAISKTTDTIRLSIQKELNRIHEESTKQNLGTVKGKSKG